MDIYLLVDRARMCGLKEVVGQVRDSIILEALDQMKGRKTATAKALKVSTGVIDGALQRREESDPWRQLKLFNK